MSPWTIIVVCPEFFMPMFLSIKIRILIFVGVGIPYSCVHLALAPYIEWQTRLCALILSIQFYNTYSNIV